MAEGRGTDVAGEFAIVRRAAAAGEFGHAVDHLMDLLPRVGGTQEFLGALGEVAARVDEAGPADPGLCQHLAAMYADCGDLDAALGWARLARELAPGAPGPRAHELAFTYAATDDIERLVELADLVRTEGGEDTTPWGLFAAVCHRVAWLGQVPGPTEALASLARNFLAGGGYTPGPDGSCDAPLVLKASALEAPSAHRAFAALFPKAEVTVQSVPEPDLRTPASPDLTYRLWTYEGTTAVPRYPEPSPEAVARLYRVADGWGDPLSVFGRSTPLGDLPEQDLLGLLVHVPPAPNAEPWTTLATRNPLYWPRYAQVWACLGWLHVLPEEPWATSTRRAVLVDLLFGCDDWTVDAAANALATAAWNLPETRGEVLGLITRRLLAVVPAAESRATELLEPLAELVLSTPGGDARTREPIRDILTMFRSRGEPETPPEYTPEALRAWGRRVKAEHDAGERRKPRRLGLRRRGES